MIFHEKRPIKRRWWEILLRKPKYDHIRTIKQIGEPDVIYINGMLQDEDE